MATSVYNNNGFSRVVDSNVNTNSLPAALEAQNLSTMKQVSGVVSATNLVAAAVGVAAVQNTNGVDVVLPAGALVQSIVLRGPDLASGGLADFVLSLGNSNTDATTALHAASAMADVILGASPAVTSVVGVTDTYLTVSVGTAAVTGGDLEVVVTYL